MTITQQHLTPFTSGDWRKLDLAGRSTDAMILEVTNMVEMWHAITILINSLDLEVTEGDWKFNLENLQPRCLVRVKFIDR
jgi:hypothetical protein